LENSQGDLLEASNAWVLNIGTPAALSFSSSVQVGRKANASTKMGAAHVWAADEEIGHDSLITNVFGYLRTARDLLRLTI